jgi:hypothetical protein
MAYGHFRPLSACNPYATKSENASLNRLKGFIFRENQWVPGSPEL